MPHEPAGTAQTEKPAFYKGEFMNLSVQAEKRLKQLLPANAAGFSVEDFIGTCRGSTPCLHPACGPETDQETVRCAGLTFFVNPDIAYKFRNCSMDFDRSFLGKGLTATWPHCEGCACNM